MNLYIRSPKGRYQAADKTAILEAAAELVEPKRGEVLSSPDDTRDFIRYKLTGREHEVFAVLFLDNRHRVIEYAEMFRGTINGASVHPREVIKEALKVNAAACIFVHNHPSGVPEPSQADRQLTNRLREGLSLVDVRALDHFIVGGGAVVSFAERGLM